MDSTASPEPPPAPALDAAPVAILMTSGGEAPACAARLERAGFSVRVCRSAEEALGAAPGAALCDIALLEARDPNRQSMEQLVHSRLSSLLDRLGPAPIPDLHSLVMREVERGLLRLILERCKGHRGKAALQLGLHRNTLRHRVAALGLEHERKPARPRAPRRKR